MHFYRLVVISFCLVAKAFCMEPSFESIYFKLLPVTYNSQCVMEVLEKAFYHDPSGRGVCPAGKQKKFTEFLIVKKRIDLKKYKNEWFFALRSAAKSANIEGLHALFANGVQGGRFNNLISVTIREWLLRTKSASHTQRINKDYLKSIKLLLAAGHSPDVTNYAYLPFEHALLHKKHLPGLLDILVLHSSSTQVLHLLAPNHKSILCASIQEANTKIAQLALDKKTYFSLLMPDINHMVNKYAFQCITEY